MDRTLEQFKRALRKGNREQVDRIFSTIYKEYKGLVVYVLGHYLKSPSDIEDLLMETFEDFNKNALGVESSIKSYLTTSARNKALNLLGKRNREEEIEDDSTVVDLSPNEDASAFEKWAVSIVGEDDYRLIYIHLFGGYTFEEMGRLLKEKSSSIKARYFRALDKLRKEKGR